MKKFLLFSGSALCFFITALTGQESIKARPFSAGEQIWYKACYNWGFIWLYAGNVNFSVKASGNNKENYHFLATGKTRKNYDWFFKVRDKFVVGT